MTDPTPVFSLADAFKTTTENMLTTFRNAGRMTRHAPTVGDGSENEWKQTLKQFLPRRYDVNTAFIVDSRGNESDQIDLVIHDRHFSPMFWTMGETLFLPAECVFAVIEVKQEINRSTIEYAAHKAASVRRLHRTSAPITQLAQSARPVEPKRILAGIVAGRSGWTTGLDGPLIDSMGGLDEEHRLDFGCALDSGMFELPEGATIDQMQRSDSEVGLAMFAMRLVARLNAVGTVPALDFDVYTSALTRRVIED
ncbi:hypothetical protein HYG77_36680 (plasmid) [Rhodococcus sp. ZPP]|uniref:DUF6602 domain-containing protein n=1 Tax=unclassified Rhodococcus (in: high G+C Gram-positive bacteria) TaxID=192944 RepID=UPI0013202507|nr:MULTISPECIES: DUF6602 domain-containing protein [unclassified Rhodococcus (in: high G+C Gram-positive bacteria)]QHE74116.1 hypothetical protein GFS60_07806 [Rhodococcus sp. WAY2]QTJ71030.1 hypothetical protein HYG77_36680 [Rhodococcus sp. ZPP]